MKTGLAGLVVCFFASLTFAEVACPTYIDMVESPVAPSGWQAKAAQRKCKLDGVQVFEKSGGHDRELAPAEKRKGDLIRQEWRLIPDNSTFFINCTYTDTDAAISIPLPPRKQSCTLTCHLDAHGKCVDIPVIRCK